MIIVNRMLKICLFLLLVLSVFGCAGKQEKIRVFWPPLPDNPNMEWLGTYASEDDFEKTATQKAVREMLGAQALRGFNRPTGIASNSDRGLVYVADSGLKNIRVYDFNKKEVGFFIESQMFRLPLGLALDSQKNLYVCDAEARKIYVMSPEAKVLRVFGNDVLSKPTNLAINERLGRIYVSDVMKSEVVVFDMEGVHLFSIAQIGQGPTDLYAPQGIAIDSEDKVYVADQLNARIQVFDRDGKHLYQFGERGDKFFNFETPRGMAIDSDGNLWVVDARKAAVFVYNRKGELLLFFDPGVKVPSYPLSLAFPTSITVDENDKVYLVDALNRRFQVWQYFSEAYKQRHPLTEEEKASQLRLLEESGNTVW